jgi:hypothetical protein
MTIFLLLCVPTGFTIRLEKKYSSIDALSILLIDRPCQFLWLKRIEKKKRKNSIQG